jgi:hypothetical protein
MILTKESIQTWTSEEAKDLPAELVTERNAWILDMVDQDKTDGIPLDLDATRTRRLWVDQAAAEEWSAWIQATATRLGAGLISVTISDITTEE